MLIKRVEAKDYKKLSKIRSSFILTPERIGKIKSAKEYSEEGFLLEEYSEEIFEKDLKKIFLIAESDSTLLGYIRIDNEIDENFINMDSKNEILWLEDTYKSIYYKIPHFELGAILVDSKSQKRGVGKLLLDYSLAAILSEIAEIQNQVTLFSFIMTQPIKNQISENFHKKNGFVKVAELKPCNMFGFKGYQSSLYAKTFGKSSNWD
jgi:GNAT superfamily N-acetyltransferase